MAYKFTQVMPDAFAKLQMNAGIMVKSFTPSTGVIGDILGATTGGFKFASNPTYVDFGADVDNCPPNTWQLKHISYFDPAISGTFLTISAANAAKLIGPAAVDGTDTTKVVPATQLKPADFDDVWVIGDYSDENEGASAGFVAVHLMHVLNTAGMQWTTTKDGKGQFAFDFHGHYDLTDITTVPFEVYVKAGTAVSG